MTVSIVEHEPEFERLTGKPEFERLSHEEKHSILLRMMKVYAANRYPHRVPAVQREIKKILRELRNSKEAT